MSAGAVLALGLLGGVGAVARFALDARVSARLGRAFPFGILAVNLTGSFAVGVLAGAAVDGDAFRLLAVGLIGAFTTFSTWAWDSRRLAVGGRPGAGALNVGLSLLLGGLAVWAGRALGGLL